MRYARKREDESMEWQLDEERTREKLVRVRRRETPMSPRVTRKMAKFDAERLAVAARREDPRHSMMPTSPPPPTTRAAAVPPPLPIPFPFPFANSASTTMPSLAVLGAIGNVEIGAMSALGSRDDSFVSVHDSWLLPPQAASMIPGAGVYRSLVPMEPEPFTVVPPAFSLPPR